MIRSRKRDPDLAIQHVHLTLRSAFGQDVARITMGVEWTAAELECVLPDGFEFRLPIPSPDDSPAAWYISGYCGQSPERADGHH